MVSIAVRTRRCDPCSPRSGDCLQIAPSWRLHQKWRLHDAIGAAPQAGVSRRGQNIRATAEYECYGRSNGHGAINPPRNTNMGNTRGPVVWEAGHPGLDTDSTDQECVAKRAIMARS